MSADQVLSYLQQAGWEQENQFYALVISWRESSFTPDVVAHCPPGTCQPGAVDAVGLMQVYWEAHPEYDYERLKEPLYNLTAAHNIFLAAGWSPWNPLPDLNGSLAQTVRGMITGEPVTVSPSVPIGGGLQITPTPVANAPTSFPAVGPQPQVAPPHPTTHYEYPHDPAPWSAGASGWDAVTRLYRNDIPYYTGWDAYLIDLLDRLSGSTE